MRNISEDSKLDADKLKKRMRSGQPRMGTVNYRFVSMTVGQLIFLYLSSWWWRHKLQ